MKSLLISVTTLLLIGLIVGGCSTDTPTVSPVDSNSIDMAVDRGPGSGSFELEAKYSYFRSYGGGKAIYLLRIIPGADFGGEATVSVDCDRLIKTEFTSTHLSAESPMTELVLSNSNKLEEGMYYLTVTVSNQTHQETIQLELEIVWWGILSMNNAITARENFIGWLNTEHPELGSFAGEQWTVYSQYQLRIVEHTTHLSENWEMRVGCHVTWIPQDYYEVYWLRPRGQWDPVVVAEMRWDDVSQSFIIFEQPLDDWIYYYGY